LLIILGFRTFYRTLGQGVFYCRECGGDRQYRHRAGRRFFTLFFIPVIPLHKTGEHVQCLTCRTRYVMDVLGLPTAAQMQAALRAGMRAAAVIMLSAGDPANVAARRCALAAIQGAGAADYTDADLDTDRNQPGELARAALNQVARQLTPDAREWFLAQVIHVGMADGLLTEPERRAARLIAADLGMTRAQAIGVITMAEQGAQQG
jgi:zinc-ribbon family